MTSMDDVFSIDGKLDPEIPLRYQRIRNFIIEYGKN